MRALCLSLLLIAACRTQPYDFDGGLPPGSVTDLAMASTPDLAGIPTSCCGMKGNPGNELGVGRFCQTSLNCQSVQANICAATFAPGLNFCTMGCQMNGPPDQCGSGAQCQCSANGQCACVPGECITPPPGC